MCFQHDLFYVASNWTLFDIGRRRNKGAENLTYGREEFSELLLESGDFLHFFVMNICRCKTQQFVPISSTYPPWYPLKIYRMPQPFKSTNLYQTVRGKRLYWFITVCPRPAPRQCSKLCQSWASSMDSPSKEMATTPHTQGPQSRWLIKIIHHDTSGHVSLIMCCVALDKGFRVYVLSLPRNMSHKIKMVCKV